MLDTIHCLGCFTETYFGNWARFRHQVYGTKWLHSAGHVGKSSLIGIRSFKRDYLSRIVSTLTSENGKGPNFQNTSFLWFILVIIWLYSVERYGDRWIGGDLEGSRDDIIEYNLGICLKGLKKTMKNLSQDSWCLGRDLNWTPPYCKYTESPLDQHVRYRNVVVCLQYIPDSRQCARKYSCPNRYFVTP
jgi:hypothetical protein